MGKNRNSIIMSGSLNKVILIGRLGIDPEVKHLEEGKTVANFSLATSESYKDKNTGERIESTDWHNIVLWNKLAEISEKYLKKGSQVYIEGSLKTRKWKDRDGNDRWTTEVLGKQIIMLGRVDSNNQQNQRINSLSENKNESDDDLPF